ncbi:metallophosphoesterase [Campylobacter hepaticus]|uniref:metallophosphoesterase n=1 Tax=Campylobacter hepaticus TaxID=1813019 RepID=UPI0029A97557|nr:metallophosphoesterase [Campylobacter hepaticus]MDX2323624.1 metallophosphoesterase [Campylobacter hepaticus]MDX2332887.1 metallophosphoesterase [Campylobacter hepaticus]MDX2409874.1 metallophosphoesterase [Campylobacter hepaticus]
MKFIHLTDIHYGNKKEAIYSREPSAMMRLAIQDINQNHNDADFVFITGDLTHKGSLESYAFLKKDLDTLQIPYYLTLGNHDNRINALTIFKNLKQDDNGFIQYEIQCDNNNVFLVLDTIKLKSHGGEYCQKRQIWLKNALEKNLNKNVFICLHHAPFKTGLKAMDLIGLDEKHSLDIYKLFNSYKNVKHLFFGHYHSTLCGRWKDISFSTLKWINHQVKFDLNSHKVLLEFRRPRICCCFA